MDKSGVRVSLVAIENQKIWLLLYNYNGKILYTLPGGNLDTDENPEECLKREWFEELQAQISIENLMGFCYVKKKNLSKKHLVYSGFLKNRPKINTYHTTAQDLVLLPISELKKITLYPPVANEILNYFQTLSINQDWGEMEQVFF